MAASDDLIRALCARSFGVGHTAAAQLSCSAHGKVALHLVLRSPACLTVSRLDSRAGCDGWGFDALLAFTYAQSMQAALPQQQPGPFCQRKREADAIPECSHGSSASRQVGSWN